MGIKLSVRSGAVATMLVSVTVLGAACNSGGESKQADESQEVRLVAIDKRFDPTSLRLPSYRFLRVTLENRDQVAHNVHLFLQTDPNNTTFQSPDVPGGTTRRWSPGVAPGKGHTYVYRCEIHPATMSGTIVFT